ncbi:MAG: GntR family transcriptional regulator [Syntrophomonadaceae bacterium]|nr:GntR family transcriptional regulator [Syntrophomonadaceae bacterium]
MPWEFKNDRPIYSQLVEQVSLFIITGVFAPGSRLPSVRELAAQAQVNPHTIQTALAELETRGLVFTERTSGRFVTEDVAMIESLRGSLAAERINTFFDSMLNLGIAPHEALSLASEAITPQREEM